MATLSLTAGLRSEYDQLFETCAVRSQYQPEIDAAAHKMIASKARYQALGSQAHVPWTLVAVLHELECGLRFDRHLHNGDPLGAKTVQVPKGRPPGAPPWTWEVSALDALTIEGFPRWSDWSVAGTLYKLEGYNGMGYRRNHPSVLTPYLWSYSNHYSSGKYKADGVFAAGLVSKQPGTAVLLRRLAELGESAFVDQPAPAAGSLPLIVAFMRAMPTNPVLLAQAKTLQRWLTSHSGMFVKDDGWAGEKTSNAYKAVTGHHLPGDPRGD